MLKHIRIKGIYPLHKCFTLKAATLGGPLFVSTS